MNVLTLARRLRSERKPIRFLASRLLKRSRLCTFFKIRCDGYVLHFYPTSLSAALWTDPTDRASDEDVLQQFLRAGDTYVDVGANIGSLASKAATLVGERGVVYCFEANPRTCAYLAGNVRLNRLQQRVQIYNYALGVSTGVIRFAAGRSDDQDHVAADGVVTVPMRRMDEVLKDVERISLLKVDVEGYEVPVLRGADKLLKRADFIYVESFEPQLRRYGYSTRDLLEVLAAHDFSVYARAASGWSRVGDTHVSVRCENLLAVSPRADARMHYHLARRDMAVHGPGNAVGRHG